MTAVELGLDLRNQRTGRVVVLTAVCCDRGAPGSTTTALALALASVGPTVLVGADPYGDDLALRLKPRDGSRMPERPTVATLAELARTTRGTDMLENIGHHLTDTCRVVPGYLSAELGTGIADWSALASGLHRADVAVVADLGRIHSASPSVAIAAAADVVVVVSRGDLDAWKHLVDRIERLHPVLVAEGKKPPLIVPVLITEKRWMTNLTGQLADLVSRSNVAVSIAHVGALPIDSVGVEALEEGRTTGRDAKNPLWVAAQQLARDIVDVHALPVGSIAVDDGSSATAHGLGVPLAAAPSASTGFGWTAHRGES